MVGGEFARAAARMAVAGAANAVVRGSPPAPGKFLRGSSKPASVFVGPSSPVPPVKATAGADVEAVMKPRIVFGTVPSFEEAKEATMEVKEALDRIFLSSSPECLALQTSPQTSVPHHAIQAFQLLKESAEAQTVVASIVSDTNVWNAMLSNEGLKSFLQSCETNKELEYLELSKELEEASDVNHAEESKMLAKASSFLHKTKEYIKTSIDDMLAKASSFLWKVFASSSAEVSGNDKATSGCSSAEIAMASTILGLVIIVVAVMVAKRK